MPRRLEHRVARVVEVPVAAGDAALGREPRAPAACRGTASGCGTWPSRCRGSRPTPRCARRPTGRRGPCRRRRRALTITPRSCRRRTAASYWSGPRGAGQVLRLAGARQVRLAQRLEADEQAAQPALHRLLEQAGTQHGLHRPGRLPHAAHALAARRTAPRRTAGCRTGCRRGSRGAGRGGGRSPPGRRRPPARRTTCRRGRTPPCSRSRRCAGSRGSPPASWARGSGRA